MKLFVGGLVVAVMTSVASAGFVVEDPPTAGNSWTQHIVAFGPFDFIRFEFLEGTGGPFELPGLSGFVDHSAGFPPPIVATWATVFDTPTLMFATGPAVDSNKLGFDIHFAGNVAEPVRFRGDAYLGGVSQFSAVFDWSGSGFMKVANVVAIPLPAAVWMGSLGILAVILFRQKIHVI